LNIGFGPALHAVEGLGPARQRLALEKFQARAKSGRPSFFDRNANGNSEVPRQDYEQLSLDFRNLREVAQDASNTRDACEFYVLESEAHLQALLTPQEQHSTRGMAWLVAHLERHSQCILLRLFGLSSKFGTSVLRPVIIFVLLQTYFVWTFLNANLRLSKFPDLTGAPSAFARAIGEAFAVAMPPLGTDVTDPSLSVLEQTNNAINMLIALDRVATLLLFVLAVIALRRRMQLG
jgi:hypothetical protein